MARKLKTYITLIGFFEEAVAAPSMKAALEAWGSDQNLFHKGFAQETGDPAITAATISHPGIVLKRPVGSKGFKRHADLPIADFIDTKPIRAPKSEKEKPLTKLDASAKKKERKAAKAYEREKQLRENQRQKEEVARKKLVEKRKVAKAKAEQTLNEAESRHDRKILALKQQLATINQKIETEEVNWEMTKKRIKAILEKLKNNC